MEATSKNVSAPVQQALAALEILRRDDPALAEAIHKILPGYAKHLEQRGTETSLERLLDDARQGAEHLKAIMRAPLARKSIEETYLSIVAGFSAEAEPTPAPEHDWHLNRTRSRLVQAATAGNLHTIKFLWAVEKIRFQVAVNGLLYGSDKIALDMFEAAMKNKHYKVCSYIASQIYAPYYSRLSHINASFIHENSLLKSAISSGDEAAVKSVLTSCTHDSISLGLLTALKCERIDLAEQLIQNGADINYAPSYKKDALEIAISKKSPALMQYIIDLGYTRHLRAKDNTILATAAATGDHIVLKFLLDAGLRLKDSEFQKSGVLNNLIATNDRAFIELLFDHGGREATKLHGDMFLYALAHCDETLIDFLIETTGALRKGGPLADGKTAARYFPMAIMRRDCHYLRKYAPLFRLKKDALNHILLQALENNYFEHAEAALDLGADRKAIPEQFKPKLEYWQARKKLWLDVARISPTGYIYPKSPHGFRPKVFDNIMTLLCHEIDHEAAHEYAFRAQQVFQSEERVLQYLQRWGSGKKSALGKTPLHDVLQVFSLPNDTAGVDFKAWGDAVLKFGPPMARLMRFCDKVPSPVRSEDGKTWSYQRTQAEVAQHFYQHGQKNPSLADFCWKHNISESVFNQALLIVTKDTDPNKKIPDITIEGERFSLPKTTFRRLAADDFRGLFLGELTDCCQSLGNYGHNCALHGYSSTNGGFYVVETDKGEVIGQAWAWRGARNELCLDSLETLGDRVSSEQWKKIIELTAAELTKDTQHDVTALHVGLGGNTPTPLRKAFEKATAIPCDHQGYRDSKEQIRVWKRKA